MGPFAGVGFADNQDFSGGADSARPFLPPPQQQPGVSQLHIPFPGKWDLYISRRLQATVIMVGFLGEYLRSEAARRGGQVAWVWGCWGQ